MIKEDQIVDITLLVCTYNRAADLRELLESALAQETHGKFTYEIVVVDNNSSDSTREVAESFITQGHDNLRYFFEEKQGKSNALNTGLNSVRGAVYIIADDDLILPKNYLSTVFDGFHAHPDVSVIGGKVLPLWKGEAPAWLTPEHWPAIAMCDYGEDELHTDKHNDLCLLAGSFRLADVKAVGGYHQELGPSKGKIGATEDFDLFQRLYKAGRKGLYVPNLALYHKVEPERMTKAYHRRWHAGHGRFYATMRDEEVERSNARLFDVPAHMFKQAAKDALVWAKCSLRRQREAAFVHESQLRFFAGFFRKRRADFSAAGRNGTVREVFSFARSLVSKKKSGSSSGTV